MQLAVIVGIAYIAPISNNVTFWYIQSLVGWIQDVEHSYLKPVVLYLTTGIWSNQFTVGFASFSCWIGVQ